MATLTPGQSYLLHFPASNFSSIFKLIETHEATERYHILYTFHDSTGNPVKFTKGVFNNIILAEWHPLTPTPPKTPPPKRNPASNHISIPDLPPVPRHLLPKQMLNFTNIPTQYQRRPSYVTLPPPIYRDMDFDELYN